MECWPRLMRCGAPVNGCNCKYVVCSAVTGSDQYGAHALDTNRSLLRQYFYFYPASGVTDQDTAPSCDTGRGDTGTVPASGLCCDAVYFIIQYRYLVLIQTAPIPSPDRVK